MPDMYGLEEKLRKIKLLFVYGWEVGLVPFISVQNTFFSNECPLLLP